jgi:hypothetical protein
MQHLMPSIGTATLAYKIDAAQYQGPSQEQKSAGARSILRNGKTHTPDAFGGDSNFLSLYAKWLWFEIHTKMLQLDAKIFLCCINYKKTLFTNFQGSEKPGRFLLF